MPASNSGLFRRLTRSGQCVIHRGVKVLLVYPSSLDDRREPIKYRKAYLPPLSLATIAGLTPRQHTVRVLNDLVENIDFSEKWDLVGLTAMTTQAERAYQIADEFRRRGTKVVMGGIHVSMMAQEAKQHADAIVIGEAENIWADLLTDCENGRLKDFYQDTNRPDLKDTVLPRWESLNMAVYTRQLGAKLPMMPIATTRGCPYGCHFCAVTKFSGQTYRIRPVANVINEIKATGANQFFFVDDNIAANPNYARELFGALQDMDVSWISQASTTILKNPDLLDRAAQAGCFALFIGIETLNQASLAGAHKSFNKTELYEELIGRMRKAGITPMLSFIFGFDQDLEDQFAVTTQFLSKNRVGSAIFWILTPAPGTDLYTDMERAGRILTKNWSIYDGTHMVFQPKTSCQVDLQNRYWNAFQGVYQPPRLFRNIMWNTRYSRRKWPALLRNGLFQPYFWLKLRNRQHPYSGGIGRVRSAIGQQPLQSK